MAGHEHFQEMVKSKRKLHDQEKIKIVQRKKKCNVSGTSFMKDYIMDMTTSVRFYKTCDSSACTDHPLDTLSTGCISGCIRHV